MKKTFTTYFDEALGATVTVVPARKPRKSERTWTKTGAVFNTGAKRTNLKNFGLAGARKRG
jgi:hypothetical protein